MPGPKAAAGAELAAEPGKPGPSRRPAQRPPARSPPAPSWRERYGVGIAAGIASAGSTAISYPLDSVKTRMQAYSFPSIRACFVHTYRTEGLAGFWRGVVSPLASTAVVRSISFSVYQLVRDRLKSDLARAAPSLAPGQGRPALHPAGTAACTALAGATAGAVSAVIACPFELTKVASQISVLLESSTAAKTKASSSKSSPGGGGGGGGATTPFLRRSTAETVRWLIDRHGYRSLYAGFRYHLIRDSAGTAVYFSTYEAARAGLGVALAAAGPDGSGNAAAVALAGGLCGVTSWVMIYPIDSAKSVYQRRWLASEPSGSAAARPAQALPAQALPTLPKLPVVTFFTRAGYRGLSVSVARSCLVNAVFFSAFEWIRPAVCGGAGPAELDGG